MTDRIAFECSKCNHPVSIDEDKPPHEEEILSCMNCGYEFGRFYFVKAFMSGASKAEVGELFAKTLRPKPNWK